MSPRSIGEAWPQGPLWSLDMTVDTSHPDHHRPWGRPTRRLEHLRQPKAPTSLRRASSKGVRGVGSVLVRLKLLPVGFPR